MNNLRIRKLGILSVAKIYAVMMFVMSLLISIPYGLVIMIFGVAILGGSEAGMGVIGGGGSIIIGILVMIGIPIFYCIMGFIGGAIGALLYNLFAGIVGGIEIEVENVY